MPSAQRTVLGNANGLASSENRAAASRPTNDVYYGRGMTL